MTEIPEPVADYLKSLPSTRFEPRSVIFREGDDAVSAFFIVEGTVAIGTENRNGAFIRLTTLAAGQMFGELALFHDNQRTATAMTETGCTISIFRRAELDRVLNDADPLLRFWIEYLARRVIDLSERVDPQLGEWHGAATGD